MNPTSGPTTGSRPGVTTRRPKPSRPGRGKRVPSGEFTSLNGEEYYRISGYHRMPPFLMSLATDTDLWMFVTSGGGLTAGRVDPDGSLFPYETVDKLYDAHHHTGPITLIRVQRRQGPATLWQPFSDRLDGVGRIERNLYKNSTGNRIVFEEINHELELAFRYRWAGSDELGWVRTATLENLSSGVRSVALLDGLMNVLPHGAPLSLYQQSSCLVDAYKRSDCDPDTGMGIFSLTAKIVDRPEAAEQLRANTVWSHGLDRYDIRLSGEAVAAFHRAEAAPPDSPLTGSRGNYLVVSSLELEPQSGAKWHLVADVGRSHLQIAALRYLIGEGGDLDGMIEEQLRSAGENLRRIVGSADGIQLTGHAEASAHHFANVLFNAMRGGVFADNYDAPRDDLVDFLETRNRAAADRHRELLAGLPREISTRDMIRTAEATGDRDLRRLSLEYLPIYFGRRHGDPSRPWNRFAIRVRNGSGARALSYEGNWRDIFQNWEALALSFPGFLPGLVAKFVNGSTVDGFNPYRITRDGVDWEIEDPADPWSFIGYWGDHQIVYLLKFLELLPRYAPGTLENLLEQDVFCYANVPYRIKPYEDILENPHRTIVYDTDLAAAIKTRVETLGTDGRLLPDPDGSVYHVNLLEKLLVPALSKLSNLVPDGGIWMNTQRPEWNDANNALVGDGISMVTLYYLRRYLAFLGGLLEKREDAATSISVEVASWLRRLQTALEENRAVLDEGTVSDGDRRRFLDAMGRAFSVYREQVYRAGFSGKTDLPVFEISALCRRATEYLDHAIRANRREDGLYHTYNLLKAEPDGDEAAVHPLYEMLEGQVAVLSSGAIEAPEAVRLLDALFESGMYREDQKSFLLYPERELPGFMNRNMIPEDRVSQVPLLTALLETADDSICARDVLGVWRFHGDFRNAADVAAVLDRLAARPQWSDRVAADRQAVLDIFEEVFHHRSFTGRSGAMYAYEGLGCVYWHMVSKLLLAVQEIALKSFRDEDPDPVRDALVQAYYRIRSGLGYEKTVSEYGAFPTDPYSHTPPHGGAQQPGMTGQVKEEILTRFGELGVVVEDGRVSFRPVLLRRNEFRKTPGTYRHHDLSGAPCSLKVSAGALAFSFCQVPVIYQLTRDVAWIRVTTSEGASSTSHDDRLDEVQSRMIFDRTGDIARIEVGVPERSLSRI